MENIRLDIYNKMIRNKIKKNIIGQGDLEVYPRYKIYIR